MSNVEIERRTKEGNRALVNACARIVELAEKDMTMSQAIREALTVACLKAWIVATESN